MITTLPRIGLLWLSGWVVLSPSLVFARDLDEATSLYSQGVHAYFAGRVSDADSLLSRALGLNDQDPRIFFFRALSRLRMGRDADARGDMAVGAALEAARANRYAVGAALQRVQGSHRLLLEKYRREARAKAISVGAERARQRGEQMNARDVGAFREKVVIPLDELFRSGDPQALPAEEITRRAPSTLQPPVVPAQPAERPMSAPAAVGDDDDPFQDDAPQREAGPFPPPSPESSLPPDDSPTEEPADENPFDF
jgi:hypothetical protein